MDDFFTSNKRLGISLPSPDKEWESYSHQEQQAILLKWERIRGHIPDRIKEVEVIINQKQEQLNVEEDFELSCQLNSEIAENASIINDLWLWYRTDQDVSQKSHL